MLGLRHALKGLKDVPAIWRNRETMRWARYERRKAATEAAAAVKAEGEETLKRRMEDPRTRPPTKLTRREMQLVDKKHKKERRRVLPLSRA
jgi:hypothetical protein